MTIKLSTEAKKKLAAEASRRGIDAYRLVEQLIDAGLTTESQPKSNQSSIDILNDWEAETATNDPAEIARRRDEFEEFKRSLNQTRRDSDGPDARIPFP